LGIRVFGVGELGLDRGELGRTLLVTRDRVDAADGVGDDADSSAPGGVAAGE
jgi:hypothetical protein